MISNWITGILFLILIYLLIGCFFAWALLNDGESLIFNKEFFLFILIWPKIVFGNNFK